MTEKETIKYGLDGLLEIFHNNGQLKYRGNYKNGKEDGLRETFYSKSNNNPFVLHGPIETRENYKDGKRDGLSEWFYENGQLSWRGNYKNGKEDGLCEGFDENGQLQSRYNLGKTTTTENEMILLNTFDDEIPF